MSTGYPAHGILAQAVQPNPKCEGCLHYESQRGQTGLCQVGLRPWTCGDGSTPTMGYAPIVGQTPGVPDDSAPVAQADAGSNGVSTPMMRTVSLGEEHVGMVKSIVQEFVMREAESCPLHHQSEQRGQSNQFVLLQQTCSCHAPSERYVAKSFTDKLTNRERHEILAEEIIEFVQGVAKGLSAGEIVLEKSLAPLMQGKPGIRPHGMYTTKPAPGGRGHTLHYTPKGGSPQQVGGVHASRAVVRNVAAKHNNAMADE